MINRYHLRYFLSVIDTGNFSRAAGACNVSQPTLSVGVAKLEKSLGAPLFNRTNRRVALTDAGARLVPYARTIEAAFAAAEREVMGAPAVQTLRVGVLTTTPRSWMERFLREYPSTAAGGQVEIVEGKERELRERLGRGRIDVALMTLRDADDYTHQRIFTEGYRLALAASHPLAGKDHIRAEDLANDPMIVRRHCELLPETSRFFTSRGIRPVFPSRTTSDDKALSYVRSGLGVTIMPDCFSGPGVVRVHLDGFDFTRDIGLVFAPHVDPAVLAQSPTIAALIAAVLPEEPT